jgi:hypothetical protein
VAFGKAAVSYGFWKSCQGKLAAEKAEGHLIAQLWLLEKLLSAAPHVIYDPTCQSLNCIFLIHPSIRRAGAGKGWSKQGHIRSVV